MGIREAKIEKYLDDRVIKIGGVTRKFTSPGRRGVCDRIVIVPLCNDAPKQHPAIIIFVEVKVVGKKPENHQLREMLKLKNLGCRACWIAGYEQVDQLIHTIHMIRDNYKNSTPVPTS